MPGEALGVAEAARDREIAGLVVSWFEGAARPLAWRTDLGTSPVPRDPYTCLVAEAMSQQTQLSRVEVYLDRFLRRFPSVAALAQADEVDVLALWSGLGYYRRARNLHAAARVIAEQFDGCVPEDVAELRRLPGVGSYTAGAVASIVFHRRAPLVDANVQRVLQRLDAHEGAGKEASAWAWERAGGLLDAIGSAEKLPAYARLNEGLMELGATICLPMPAQARCGSCPLAGHCLARAKGLVGVIPRPKGVSVKKTLVCAVVVVVDAGGRVLVEQRAERGMWSKMWQAPTLECAKRPTQQQVAEFAVMKSADGARLVRAGGFVHQTTHRTIRFVIFAVRAVACRRKGGAGRKWVHPGALQGLGISTAARRAIEMGVGAFGYPGPPVRASHLPPISDR